MDDNVLVSIVYMLSKAPLVYLAGVCFTATTFTWMRGVIKEEKFKSQWSYIFIILANGLVPTVLSIPENPIMVKLNPAIIMFVTSLILVLEFAVITRDKLVVYIYFFGVIMLQYACFFGIGATAITSINIPGVSVLDDLFRSSTLTFTMYLLSLAIGIYAFITRNYKDILSLILHDWTSGSTLFFYMILNGMVLGIISGYDYEIYFSGDDITLLRKKIIIGMILRYTLILITSYLMVYIQFRREVYRHKAHEFEETSHKDSLTGVLNRAAFRGHVQECLFRTPVDGEKNKGVIFMIDLDNFKNVNDTLGHPVGDEVLIKASLIMKSLFRETDYVCRLGGDEFCILLAEECSYDLINSKARLLNDKLRISIDNPNGGPISISASIGVAIFPNHGDTYDSLYKSADLALYSSKMKGRDCYTIYEPENSDQ